MKDVKVLRGLEAVRARPEMYLPIDDEGYFQLLKMQLDKAGEDHGSSLVALTIHKNGGWTLFDDGRLMPTAKMESLVMELHACRCLGDECGHEHNFTYPMAAAFSKLLQVDQWEPGGQQTQMVVQEGQVVISPFTNLNYDPIPFGKPQGFQLQFYPDWSILSKVQKREPNMAKVLEWMQNKLPKIRTNLVWIFQYS